MAPHFNDRIFKLEQFTVCFLLIWVWTLKHTTRHYSLTITHREKEAQAGHPNTRGDDLHWWQSLLWHHFLFEPPECLTTQHRKIKRIYRHWKELFSYNRQEVLVSDTLLLTTTFRSCLMFEKYGCCLLLSQHRLSNKLETSKFSFSVSVKLSMLAKLVASCPNAGQLMALYLFLMRSWTPPADDLL